MVWTIDQRIRVGDNVDNLLLGQMALEIDALHDGFIGGPSGGGTNQTFTLTQDVLEMPAGLKHNTYIAPYSIYSFSTGYKRKPPYLLVANFSLSRPTNLAALGWIIRQPHYIQDTGREYTSITPGYVDWGVETLKSGIISNIEASSPDGYFSVAANAAFVQVSMYRLVLEDLPVRYLYSDGTTYTLYDEYYHIALAASAGSIANTVSAYNLNVTIIGGR